MLDRKTLKQRLHYQGKQYTNGQYARGGDHGGKHMLTQAAERIEELENGLNDLLNDCINFANKGQLTDSILERASSLLEGRDGVDVHEKYDGLFIPLPR
jgi:hypothetical protein